MVVWVVFFSFWCLFFRYCWTSHADFNSYSNRKLVTSQTRFCIPSLAKKGVFFAKSHWITQSYAKKKINNVIELCTLKLSVFMKFHMFFSFSAFVFKWQHFSYSININRVINRIMYACISLSFMYPVVQKNTCISD